VCCESADGRHSVVSTLISSEVESKSQREPVLCWTAATHGAHPFASRIARSLDEWLRNGGISIAWMWTASYSRITRFWHIPPRCPHPPTIARSDFVKHILESLLCFSHCGASSEYVEQALGHEEAKQPLGQLYGIASRSTLTFYEPQTLCGIPNRLRLRVAPVTYAETYLCATLCVCRD
jgi:hypothetical protein